MQRESSAIDLNGFARRLARYFDPFLDEHGPTARGVDWKSVEAQELRFRQLLKVVDSTGPFSINDYGCGYGALIPYLRERGFKYSYTGFDLTPRMLDHARELFGDSPECTFVASESELEPATYTVASGVLNLRLDIDDESWTRYAIGVIHSLDRLSRAGFAFNMLTKYSDPELMRDDLYYADPYFFFDHCRRNVSRNVALLHDYGAYEFTIIVRSEAPPG
jgi:SAM-dependent methyltransferase